MVRVAVCPKCSHESVMFDQPDSEQWARCPECRTYFQLKHAAAREIPQLVMTEDEALLSEEESEGAKDTVVAALETRWDTRSTLDAASTQTIAGVEPAATSPPAETGKASDELSPPENAKDAARRTVSDLSSLATWSDLPVDQTEAQARAEEAGDAPTDDPLPSATPTLLLRRTRVANEDASGATNAPQPTDDSGDRFDKWFQTKETIFDFTPPSTNQVGGNLTGEAPPLIAADASLNSDVVEQSKSEAPAAADEERSTEDEEPESAATNSERGATSTPQVPAWPQGRPIPNWSRPSRRHSPLRMFIMIGFGGIVGTALGYYALLWLFGPQRDFLNAGQYLPSAILPREFRSPVVTLPTNDATTTETTGAADLAAGHEEPIEIDQMPPMEESSESAADAREPAVIVGAPSFSADELAVALGKAKEAQAGLVAGNLDDGAAVKRTKGQSYMAFCDLAQKATFVDKDSNASYASALEREVIELVRTTVADDAHAQKELARLVPLWIKSAKRTHAGILVAGHVAREEVRGGFVEWQVDMGHDSITVLADASKALVDPPTRPVVILGWIVDNPAEQVSGYPGQAQQAVWAGHIIPLE